MKKLYIELPIIAYRCCPISGDVSLHYMEYELPLTLPNHLYFPVREVMAPVISSLRATLSQ